MKPDKKDLKILEQLELNSRQSNSQIAKKVGLSKDAVSYRIANLEKQGIIRGYYSVLNIAKLGLIQYKVLISFQNTNTKIETEIINYLIKNTGWVVSCDGYYNLLVVLWVKNSIDFDKFFVKFLNKYSQYLKEREVVVLPEEYSCRRSYLFNKSLNNMPIVYYGGEPSFNLDKKDLVIIKELANNSRISLVELSSKINLTSEAISNRVKRLQKENILLAFKPNLNASLLGYSFYNILFKLKKVSNLSKIYEYLSRNPNVLYYGRYSGAYDLGIDLEISNISDLRSFISDFKDKFKEDIQSYVSILVYREHKLSYFPEH